MHALFGERARRIPVNSVKAMIGHCLGAAGAMEAEVLALTIARGVIPLTIHHTATDPECDLDVVANPPREMRALRRCRPRSPSAATIPRWSCAAA